MSKNSFLKGAAVLGVAGILVKVLGAFYRIPLVNMIGDEGMGYYQTSYPLYNLLFSISTAGFPVAVAKLVAEKRAIGDYRGSQKVFKIAFLGLIIGGILTSSFIFFGANSIVNKIGNSNAYYAMIALTPALFFVPIMSAFRGYFQGRQDMVPTALSQIVEQLFRVVVGLFLAYSLLDEGLPQAAGGASFGASAGAIAGTILILIIYLIKRKNINKELDKDSECTDEKTVIIIKNILSIAIPITVGACIVPLINTIDVAIVMRRLQSIGYTETEASGLYGQLAGMAQTLINFPQVFSIAIAMSLVPAISEVYARKNFDGIKKITQSGVRVTLFIGLPSALGLYILSTPIIKLLYFSRPLAEQESAGSILSILAFSVLFLTLVQSLTAILQGLGKPIIPVKNLVIGAIFKIFLTYILTGIPSINVKGAAISTIAAYLVASILNFIAVKRYTKTHFDILSVFVKPIISVILMTLTAFYSFNYLSNIISQKISTVLAILMAAVVYGFALLITGSITLKDFELLPGGEKIAGFLNKIGLLKN